MSLEVIEVNNKDDIELCLTLTDIDGAPIQYLEFDWKIAIYTIPTQVFEVTHWGGVLSSNAKVEGTALRVFIPGFNWGNAGRLMVKFFGSYVNENFPDGRQNSTTVPSELPITIVNV